MRRTMHSVMNSAMAGMLGGALLLCAGCGAPPAANGPTPPAADADERAAIERVETEHLPNVVRVHRQVLSGGLPEGDAAFAELKRLGVRTIISVDGARPDVALAEKHGLRYVHLPHGYDGIPDERAAALAKGVRELPGPIYLHCHHGKHRSPAAAAVACVGAGWLEPSQAEEVLALAGTSPHYRGLFAAARAARPLSAEALAEIPDDFPAVVAASPLAEAMVALERTHDHLRQLEKNAWRPLPRQPDLEAAHEALLLREHFTELRRAAEGDPADYRDWLAASERAAQGLEEVLRQGKLDQAARALGAVTQHCQACHMRYRDVPRDERPVHDPPTR